MAVVAVIAGILAVVATPSMLGSMRKSELQATANQVKGALREAQRAAIRNGSGCTATISSTSPQILGTTAGCITSPVALSSGITLSATSTTSGGSVTNLTLPQSLSFSYKGNPSNADELTLILAPPEATGLTPAQITARGIERRCIVISVGIGIMRSGTYNDTTCTSTL